MKLKILMCVSMQMLLIPLTYAATTEMNTLNQNSSPYHNNRIIGKTAGGDNQTTIIDDNGNLKIVEKSKQSSATNPPSPTAPGNQSMGPTNSPTVKEKPPVHQFKSDTENMQNPGPPQNPTQTGQINPNAMPNMQSPPMNSQSYGPPQQFVNPTDNTGPVQSDLQPVPGGAQARITP